MAVPISGPFGPFNARQVALYSLCLFVLAAGTYWRSVGGDFAWDDNPLILADARVQQSEGLASVFTQPFSTPTVEWQVSYYRPVTTLSYVLNHWLSGNRPFSYHLLNVLLHGMASVEVFLLTLAVFGSAGAALAAAVLFALHPAHVPSVAWVSGRTDSLCAVFLLAALLFYAMARTRRRPWKLKALSLACFVAALGSKEAAFLFPAAVLLLDLCRAGFSLRAAIRQADKLYYGMVLALLGAFVAAHHAITSHHGGGLSAATLLAGLQTSPLRLSMYLRSLCFPFGLSGFYLAEETTVRAVLLGYIPAAALLALATWRRRDRMVLFGILWFVVFLVPVLNVVPLGVYTGGDHLLYLPSVGGILAIVGLLAAAVRAVPNARAAGRVSVATLAVVSCLFAWETQRYIGFWHDDVSLWRHLVQGNPGSALAHNSLGLALLDKGDVVAAERAFRDGLSAEPGDWRLWFGLAEVSVRRGDYAAAERYLREAMTRDSAHSLIHYYLGNIACLRKDYAGARAAYEQAVRLNPRDYQSMYSLGRVLEMTGCPAEARRHFEEFIRSAPAAFDAPKRELRARLQAH